jgi:ketosteroid isomerase-like protein
MKALMVAAALVVLIGPALEGQAARNQATVIAEQEIRQHLREWDEAYQHRDAQKLAAFLADDFTLTDATGAVLNKGQYLMSIVKAPDFSRVTSWASEDVTVQVNGDKAVVTGRSPVKGRGRGKAQAIAGNYRFTDQWVRQQGTWKAKETRATRIDSVKRP